MQVAQLKRAILAVIATTLLGMCGDVLAQEVLSEDFTTDPRLAADPWTYSGWDMGTYPGGWSADGYANVPTDWSRFWRSPDFAVAPYEYFRIAFQSKGAAAVCGLGLNPAATWGRYPSANIQAGQLVADDWTVTHPTSEWTDQVYYTRARANSVTSCIRLGPGQFNSVSVSLATRSEVRTWADAIYAQMPAVSYTPAPGRFARLSRTIEKLESGETVRIVMLGDSIMNDTGNSALDVLLERRYPGSRVEIVTAVGGGTGMDEWNAENWNANATYNWPNRDLDLQGAVIDQTPDLVMIGGVSSGTAYDDIREMIDKVKSGILADHLYNVDVLLMTGAFGYHPPDATDPPGYATQLAAIAADKEIAFMDMRAVWAQYIADAAGLGYDQDFFYRDGTHGNAYGKQILSRALEIHLTPEPTSAVVLMVGGLFLAARKRCRRAR